ncbi:MAG: MFS transporter [Betaproteobacteria bacterium]|nr:MFS transporter [Betaproteobacteria bacterium]MDE1954676.1 MFS transporter [Betaproteobacteria bacterium]
MSSPSTPGPAAPPDPIAQASGTAEEPLSLARFVELFTAVMLPILLAAIDQTLLATATPAIARDFDNLHDSTWIAVGYLLASTIMAPLYGRLGDRYGRREALLGALGLFALGSLACTASPGMWWLIAARVLQGLGGGGLMVMSQALIGEVVSPRQRPRFQAWLSGVFVLSSVVGPVVGGLVVSRYSWRWLFVANLPLCALAAWRVGLLAKGAGHAEPGQGHDAAGVLMFAGCAGLSLLWLTLAGHRFGWLSLPSLAMAACALVLGWLLLRHERRQRHPFLPVELLRIPATAWTALTVVLFAACMFALVFFLPVYLQIARHGSAARAGLLLLPLTAGLVLGSNVTGRIIARSGRPDLPPRYGLVLSALALLALALVPPGGLTVGVLGLVAGLGFGSVMPSSQLLVQAVAGRSRLGAAAATISLARSTGASLGTAVFGSLVFGIASPGDLRAALNLSGSAGAAAAQRVTQAFHIGFGAAALVALAAVFVARRVPRVDL